MPLGTWPPEDWPDEEIITSAIWHGRVRDPFNDLDQNKHTGADGDGSADIEPDTVTFDDQVSLTEPAVGDTKIGAVGGVLTQFAEGGAETGFSLEGHTHTVQVELPAAETIQTVKQVNDSSTRNPTGSDVFANFVPKTICTRQATVRDSRAFVSAVILARFVTTGGVLPDITIRTEVDGTVLETFTDTAPEVTLTWELFQTGQKDVSAGIIEWNVQFTSTSTGASDGIYKWVRMYSGTMYAA